MVHQSSHISEVTEQRNAGFHSFARRALSVLHRLLWRCLKGLSSTVRRLGDWNITDRRLRSGCPARHREIPPKRNGGKSVWRGCIFVVGCMASGPGEL